MSRVVNLGSIGILALLLAAPAHADDGGYDATAIYAKAKAAYAQLRSYSDTGTLVTDYHAQGPAIVEHYAFATAFRPPRQFIFDSQKASNGERFVIWADGGDFNTFWSATNVTDDYPQGQGDTAFAVSSAPTQEATVTIAPLLFPQAELQGPLANFGDLSAEGFEAVDGHRCYKIGGTIAIAYGTGTVTGARPATVWIDAGSLLVRKLFEDTAAGTATGVTDQTTMAFDPVANPELDANRFQFTPPK